MSLQPIELARFETKYTHEHTTYLCYISRLNKRGTKGLNKSVCIRFLPNKT